MASWGVLPYSLGWGVPLGSRKSCPLLDQILWPYTRPRMGSSRKYPYPYHGWHFGIPNAWGVLWSGILNARGGCWDWNSKCMRGFLVLEFRRGRGLKTLIYWLLKFRKPVLYARVLNKLSRKGMTMKLGCAAYLELPWNACFRQLFQWSFRWLIHC